MTMKIVSRLTASLAILTLLITAAVACSVPVVTLGSTSTMGATVIVNYSVDAPSTVYWFNNNTGGAGSAVVQSGGQFWIPLAAGTNRISLHAENGCGEGPTIRFSVDY